jgi:asparagine synthase (glutamine-hydrolysing)
MPGIIGFLGNSNQEDANNLITSMALALHPEPRFKKDLFSKEGIGFGRVSLGLVNSQPQPVFNGDKTVSLVMEGELYAYRGMKRSLLASGRPAENYNNDAEYVMQLYEEKGEDFAAELNGQFAVAIWDRSKNKLILANDHLGLVPIYYTKLKGRFLFGSGVRSLLVDQNLPRKIDLITIAQYLTFDHLLDDRTLLENVKILPPGSILTYHYDELQIKNYWKPQYHEVSSICSEQDYVEGLIYHLRQAVTRNSFDNLSSGFLLSGGLDSRVLLGFYNEITNNKFHTFTFGIPGCDDARFARQASRLTKAQHHFYELKPDYLINNIEEGIRSTDGLQNCVHMHSLANLYKISDYVQVIYKGFLGDALMGYGQTRNQWANVSNEVNPQYQFQIHQDQGLILFPFYELKKIINEPNSLDIQNTVFDSYSKSLQEANTLLLADQRHFFDIRFRIPRMTLNGVELVRSQTIVRMPFTDRDLIDYVLSLPPGLRFDRYLIKKAFISLFPDLAKVPYTATGLPMLPSIRTILMQADHHLRWYLRNHGVKWTPVKKSLPYADYNYWFRTVLSEWVEDILLDKNSLDRGYFKADAIRSLVSEHMNGANHAAKLGALISLELWHRIFID